MTSVASSAATPARRSWLAAVPPWVPALVALFAAGILLIVFTEQSLEIGVFWAIGLALGAILQRSRFCFAGAFRDLIISRDGRLMRALLVGLMIATPAFALLMARLVPNPAFGDLPPGAHVLPIGLHLVVGGIVFGIGMVIAGGCVSGNLFRAGEGYVASWVAIGGILVGLLAASWTWNWWWLNHIRFMPSIWLPEYLGHLGGLVVTMLLLAAAWMAVHWWESRGDGMPAIPGRPRVADPDFAGRMRHWYQTIVVRGWPVLAGGIALAVLNIVAFNFDHPIGVTGELSAWSSRFAGVAGVAPGPLLGVDQFAGCNLVAEGGVWLTSAFTLTFGLVAGSFIAALASGEFKIRTPRKGTRYLQQVGGGALLGYGAGIAVGCTLGGFFSAVPSLSLSGWIFGLAILGGAFLGTRILPRLG